MPASAFGPAIRAFAAQNNIVAVNTFDPRSLTQTIVDPKFRSPYAEQWSLGIQRQINPRTVAEVRYLGTHGVGLFQQAITNPQFNRLITGFSATVKDAANQNVTITFPGFPNLVPQGLTPTVCPNYPGVSHVTCDGRILPQARVLSRQNSAQSIYHSLQTRFGTRLFNQFTFQASYTFSKALDNASEIFAFQESPTAQDPFSIGHQERGYSGFDRRHAAAFNWLWDVPLYKSQEGLLGHLLGGFQLNGTYVVANGLRFTPRQNFNNNLLGGPTYVDYTTGDVLRPFTANPKADPMSVAITDIDLALLGLAPYTKSPTGLYSLTAFNKTKQLVPISLSDAFLVANLPGAAKMFGTPFGNAGRNSLIGPLLNQINMGIFKNTRIKERFTLQLRLEAFNVFNHPNPGYGLDSAPATFNNGAVPDNNLQDAGISFMDPKQVEYNRRIIQLGIRFVF